MTATTDRGPARRRRFEASGPGRLLARCLAEDAGADIVEYALLGALIGIAAVAIWQQLAADVGQYYGEADAGVQGISACTPDPGGGGC